LRIGRIGRRTKSAYLNVRIFYRIRTRLTGRLTIRRRATGTRLRGARILTARRRLT
jgi:hypothetical protein